MKKTYLLMIAGVLALVPATRAVDRIVTTEASTGAGSLTAAINALNDGDRVTFNIPPGAGEVHYIQVPADGFPLIAKNNITIDGYTQNGASPNTAALHATNNAVLKIVLTATNGNALSMGAACATSWGAALDFGYGDDEQAILGFFHATNAIVRGLVIQSAPTTTTSITSGDCKSICFAAVPLEVGGWKCENWQVCGCWFGIDPVTKQVAYMTDGATLATPTICVASYRSRNVVGGSEPTWNYNWPGTIGVAAKSANPSAEFNVFVTGYGFDAEGHDFRASGNFFNVLPDGVTPADMSVINGGAQLGDGYFECGRNINNLLFGTDGDGVNDADEGNVCCGFASGGAVCMDLYGWSPGTNVVVAGNYFNADIHRITFGPNLGVIVDSVGNTGTLRFGSDFNGVSDALEGNLAFNEWLVGFDSTWPTNTAWISMRGNSMTNCTSTIGGRPPLGDANTEGYNTYANFVDAINSAIIPVIAGTTTASSLSGSCGLPLGAPYTNLVIDLYEADPNPADVPQGMTWKASFTDNSAADSNPAVGAFTFSTAGLGLTSGMKITIAVTYSSDTRPRIASVSRAGNQSTVTINNPGAAYYGIQKSPTLSPSSFSTAAVAAGGLATFTDNNSPASFYRATGPTATGQTSPFSDVFTIP